MAPRAMIQRTALRAIPLGILAREKPAEALPGRKLLWMGRQRSPEGPACGQPLDGCPRICSRH